MTSLSLPLTGLFQLGSRRARHLVERNIYVYRHTWIVILSGFFEPLFYLGSIGFGLGALVPIVPFLILPVAMALPAAALATGLVLFGIGVVKSRWTHRSALSSGLEVLALAAFAGIAGYLFGTVLPQLLGVAGISA